MPLYETNWTGKVASRFLKRSRFSSRNGYQASKERAIMLTELLTGAKIHAVMCPWVVEGLHLRNKERIHHTHPAPISYFFKCLAFPEAQAVESLFIIREWAEEIYW